MNHASDTIPKQSSVLGIWKWALLGAPLWWVLGLNLFFYHLMAVICVMWMVREMEKQNRDIWIAPSSFFLFFIFLISLFSILIHGYTSGTQRMLAAGYNATFWLMGFLLVTVFSNSFSQKDVPPFLAIFSRFSLMSAALTIAVFLLVATGIRTLIFETPLYGLTEYLGGAELIKDSTMVRVLQPNWFISAMHPRFNLYSPYPTAAGAVFLITLFMLLTWARSAHRTRSIYFIVLFSANLFALTMTLARASILIFFLSLTMVYILQGRRSGFKIFFSIILLVFVFPWIEKGFEFVLSLRGGSTITRLNVYFHSLQQLEGIDWMMGLGIKPREHAFHIPLGSHSTYLSLLLRTGVIGFLSFFSFQLLLLARWFQLKDTVLQNRQNFLFWQGLGCVFIGVGLWMVVDDLDAPQLLAFVYFSCVGIFEGFRREVLANPRIGIP